MSMNSLKRAEMKTKIIIAILFSAIILSGCGEYDRIDAIPGVYVNESSVNMLVGDKVQLQASPMAGVYTWKSVDPSVASVSQTGEVTAVTAGSTDIIVMKSGQDDVQAQVSVNIRDRIYLDNIKLNPSALEISSLGATVQVLAVTEPSIITVPYDPIVWTSDNPQIATVNANGLVTSVGRGVTKIRAGSGDIESVIDVTVYQIQMSDRTQFSIASVSDQTEWDGGGVNVILQQFDTWMTQDRFWHSKWDGGAAPCPHWVVIDMGKERTISTIEIFRRFNNSDTKTVQSYVGNAPDPNA